MRKKSDEEFLLWMQELRKKIEKEKEEDKKRTPLQRQIKRIKFTVRNYYFMLKYEMERIHFDFAPNHFVIGAIYDSFGFKELHIYFVPCLRVRIEL
jgi:hypothetical protein